MDERVPGIRKHLKKKLDPYRFEHTLGVAYTCQALAMRYGYDLDKAELAGLLHDCAKRFDNQKMLEKCEQRGIPATEQERDDPSLLHAKLGACFAREKYGVEDEEILAAIACHTTGKPNMGLLDKILYVADFIEPRRTKAENLPQMRRLAFLDLDEACLQIMEGILDYLQKSGSSIDPTTIAACEDMRLTVTQNRKKEDNPIETAGEGNGEARSQRTRRKKRRKYQDH